MKLYELPRNSHFRIVGDTHAPPDAPALNTTETYWFGKVDGMYSYCKDSKGNVCHVVAWADVQELSVKD